MGRNHQRGATLAGTASGTRTIDIVWWRCTLLQPIKISILAAGLNWQCCFAEFSLDEFISRGTIRALTRWGQRAWCDFLLWSLLLLNGGFAAYNLGWLSKFSLRIRTRPERLKKQHHTEQISLLSATAMQNCWLRNKRKKEQVEGNEYNDSDNRPKPDPWLKRRLAHLRLFAWN